MNAMECLLTRLDYRQSSYVCGGLNICHDSIEEAHRRRGGEISGSEIRQSIAEFNFCNGAERMRKWGLGLRPK